MSVKDLSYCAHEVLEYDRDLFLRSLFAPSDMREPLLAVYALIVELDKIPSMVSEEMIGHIRYAWWQEMVEGLYEGKVPHGHPVMEALASLIKAERLPKQLLLPLVEVYREAYPVPPANKDAIITNVSTTLLQSLSAEAVAAWISADKTIVGHHRRYGKRIRGWMLIKLLIKVIL